ncbi:MAG: class I SAM-dependent rRNA methyltransferase, partial [Bacteroidales bacterium]|nr:class I SAM-dependent rRNA methyltransferase [Candidatus Sodaliphilus fimicaballi]
MEYKVIKLRRGKEESLKRFHPWVFSGAIDAMDETIEEGDLVSVYTHDGKHVGNG